MARKGYGVPEIEARQIGGTGPGGQVTTNAGMSVNDLYSAAMASESYGRQLNEAVRQLIGGRGGMNTMMARSGVAPQFGQFAHQQAARTPMVSNPTNPMIEVAAGQQMAQAQSRALQDEIQRLIAENSPSGLSKFLGVAGPLAGMALGGYGTDADGKFEFDATGAGMGGQFGSMLASMMNSY